MTQSSEFQCTPREGSVVIKTAGHPLRLTNYSFNLLNLTIQEMQDHDANCKYWEQKFLYMCSVFGPLYILSNRNVVHANVIMVEWLNKYSEHFTCAWLYFSCYLLRRSHTWALFQIATTFYVKNVFHLAVLYKTII